MTNPEPDNGTTRDDLLQRVALMETMIAEGRRSTTRHGWIFVLWGLIYLAPMGWQLAVPHSEWVSTWAWPVCIALGAALTVVGKAMQSREHGRRRSIQCRSVEAVWIMMGVTITLYFVTAMVRHFTWQLSYAAAILMFVGMAHAISALILRWRVQGLVAGIWWMGGVATFFASHRNQVYLIFAGAAFFGMILFGLYAMILERRRAAGAEQHHA
jgi:hypothetical protein